MKIGLTRHPVDLSIKHIKFEVNGESHFISFAFSHRKGVTGPVMFDCEEAKIIDAYPPLYKLVRMSASIIWNDLGRFIRSVPHNK